MLVQSKFKAGDILVLKTSTGEEILAKLISEDMLVYVVAKPATIVISRTETGQIGIDLQPSMFSMDINTNIDVHKSGIIMVSKARKDLSDAYIQSTSGIQVAGANALNGL